MNDNIVVFGRKEKKDNPPSVKVIVLILVGVFVVATIVLGKNEKFLSYFLSFQQKQEVTVMEPDGTPLMENENTGQKSGQENTGEENTGELNKEDGGKEEDGGQESVEGENNSQNTGEKDSGDSNKEEKSNATEDLTGSAVTDADIDSEKGDTGSAVSLKETGGKKITDNFVEIKKIGSLAPIVETESTNLDTLHKLLDYGVVLYPGSAPFGKRGLTVLLGHSAPANWPNIKYDQVFSNLNKLSSGDTVVVDHDGAKYSYKVLDTQIIEKGGSVVERNPNGNTLVLMSCWPPGRDQKRIVVQAAFIGD